MKVILNSDVLYHSQLVTGALSSSLQEFFRTCFEFGITIVIPTTTLLEFDKKQSEFVQQSITRLQGAYAQLDKYGISYTRVEPSEVIKQPDLIEMISRTGASVEIVEPTLEDFSEAHRRACLHESPHPPEIKSDEMRDLVIWIIALGMASKHDRTLLISRDEVHTHPRGDSEASKVRLVRIKSIDEATEYIGRENPSVNIIKELLEPVWSELINSELPIADPMVITTVSQARFIQGDHGPSSAYFILEASASEGDVMKADVEIQTANGLITKVILSNISIDGMPWRVTHLEITPNKPFGKEGDDYINRLNALRQIIER